jgi:hypothetical protein
MNTTNAAVLRSAADIKEDTPMAVLVATFNAMTGKSIKKFENRTIAEARVRNALMAAQDATAHLGVPPNQNTPPVPLTVEERQEKAEETGRETPAVLPIPSGDAEADAQDAPAVATKPTQAPAPEEEVNPYQPGTIEHGLWLQGRTPKAAPKSSRPAGAVARPKPQPYNGMEVSPGWTTLRPSSARSVIMNWMREQPGMQATVEAIEAAHGGKACRGHLQKLVEGGHLKKVTIGGDAPAPAAAPAPGTADLFTASAAPEPAQTVTDETNTASAEE